MDHSSLSMLADVALDTLYPKRRVASNRVPSKCAQCHNSWPTALALESHAKSAHHEAWVCGVVGCGVGFKNRSAFSKHKSRHKNPAREYPCQECGHVFAREDNLGEHRAIQGRCKPSNNYKVAQCSSEQSKRRRLENHNEPVLPAEILNATVSTNFVPPQLSDFLPSMELGHHEWSRLSIEPAKAFEIADSSVVDPQNWEDTYIRIEDQPTDEHSRRPGLGAGSSKANDQSFNSTLGHSGDCSSPEHPIRQRIDKIINSDTANNAFLFRDVHHADGDMLNSPSILPCEISGVVTVVASPSHDSADVVILSSDESEADIDSPPASRIVLGSQQDPPWLKWLQQRREAIKSRGGYYRYREKYYYVHKAMKLQIVLEFALLYYGEHPQILHDIMSTLSIAGLLEPKERLKQAPAWFSYEVPIEECCSALIPDLPTLGSFFGRGLFVDTGPCRTLWSFAVRFGDPGLVELLLQKGAHPDQELWGSSSSERIPLVVACDDRHWDVAKVLLRSGANPDVCNDGEESVLSIAALCGNFAVVQLLLQKKADPNLNGQRKVYIPLLSAIGSDHIDIVELLLQQGADVNIKGYEYRVYSGKTRCTPLLLAITKKHIGMVDLLLRNGANIDGLNEDRIPLLVAVGMGCTDVVELLLQQGADVNIEGYEYKLVPDGVCYEGAHYYTPLIYAIHKADNRIAKLLLERGADPNLVCGGVYCPLLMAINNSWTEVVELLLEKGADVNLKGHDLAFNDGTSQCTPLIYAIYHRQDRIVRLLLEKGADPSLAREYWSTSPLLMAIGYGRIVVIEALLSKGADVNMIGADGAFMEGAAECTPLMLAIDAGHRDIARLLLEKGADPNLNCDEDFYFPLIMAVTNDWTDIVELLLDKGARANATGRHYDLYDSQMQCTPLMLASYQGHIAMVKLLLERGANPNPDMQNDKQVTPLTSATWFGYAAIAKLLIDNGANVNAKGLDPLALDYWEIDEDRLSRIRPITPFCAAIGQGENNDIVRLLLDHGANPDVTAINRSQLGIFNRALLFDRAGTVRLLSMRNAVAEPRIGGRISDWIDGNDDEEDDDGGCDTRNLLDHECREISKLIEEAKLKRRG